MTSEPDEQEPERDSEANSDENNDGESTAQVDRAEDNQHGAILPAHESAEGALTEPLESTEPAITRPVIATQAPFRQQFQKRALKYIAWLIVFFAVATLGTAVGAAFLPDENARSAVATLSSDIAKSAIPTLIALLGTAAAWAFKDSDKD